jgi:acetyltransferase-like isoleucine patch superfamily enzyme
MLKRVWFLALSVLPSSWKIRILNRLGHEIHPTCRLGMSYLDIKKMVLGPHVQIAGFNYFKGLQLLEMKRASRIGGKFSWFTASTLHMGTEVNHFGVLRIGEGSNITGRHFFDVQRSITIGSNTLIAGFHSTFWTHGYHAEVMKIEKGITIGSRCYVGSTVTFLPGSAIGDKVMVGTCSVVAKDFSEQSCCLIVGNPAQIKQTYAGSEIFFDTEHEGFLPKPR